MSESVDISSTELLDPENVGVTFGISLISCVDTEIMRCFISASGFLAVIFDLRLTPTLHSMNMSLVVFLDHKNFGLVLGFQLVPRIEAETKVFHKLR